MANVTVNGHYSNKPMTISDDYQEQYKSDIAKGFSVDFVHDYSGDIDGNIVSEMHISTPYFYNGQAISAYACVPLSNDKIRDANTCELWLGDPCSSWGRNLEDVCANSDIDLSDADITDKDGNHVDFDAADDAVWAFSSAASHYPHVRTYSEYMDVTPVENEKLGISTEVSEDTYKGYLKECDTNQLNRQTYIGNNRVIDCEMDIPSVQQGRDEYDEWYNSQFGE